jgi:uncharacterized protein
MILQNNLLELVTYVSLVFAFVSFWLVGDRKFPLGFFVLSILFALISNQIGLLALLPIALITISLHYFYQAKLSFWIKFILFLVIVITTILLFAHKLPEYNNWLVFPNLKLSESSADFNFWINFDKPMVGFLLLLIAYQPIRKWTDCRKMFSEGFWIFVVITIFTLLIFGINASYLVFDPKLPDVKFMSFWFVKMLFFTVIVEELFFRFFIQDNIVGLLTKLKYGKIIGLVLTSFLFGLCHLPAGIILATLAFISGLLYGGIYLITKRLEAAVLLHFTVNFIHLICFSYPSYKLVL